MRKCHDTERVKLFDQQFTNISLYSLLFNFCLKPLSIWANLAVWFLVKGLEKASTQGGHSHCGRGSLLRERLLQYPRVVESYIEWYQ
jgi:hypothetical protein